MFLRRWLSISVSNTVMSTVPKVQYMFNALLVRVKHIFLILFYTQRVTHVECRNTLMETNRTFECNWVLRGRRNRSLVLYSQFRFPIKVSHCRIMDSTVSFLQESEIPTASGALLWKPVIFIQKILVDFALIKDLIGKQDKRDFWFPCLPTDTLFSNASFKVVILMNA